MKERHVLRHTVTGICAAPVVVLYLVFHRYVVGGLTAGGVK